MLHQLEEREQEKNDNEKQETKSESMILDKYVKRKFTMIT